MRKLLLILAVTSACKKGDEAKKTDEAAKPTTVETTKTEPPPVKTEPAPVKPEPAAAPVKAATLATGETLQGCFAWSATKKAAACVVGEQGTADREISLAYVGTDARSELADSVDDNTAKKENETLAKDGYVAFTDKAVDVVKDTKTDAGGSLSLTWTIKQTKKGGNNVAPSNAGKVTASCSGKDTVIFEQKEEEGRSFTVALRKLGTHALVEVKTSVGREGEYSHGVHAFLIDTASCAVATGPWQPCASE